MEGDGGVVVVKRCCIVVGRWNRFGHFGIISSTGYHGHPSCLFCRALQLWVGLLGGNLSIFDFKKGSWEEG